MFLPQRAAPASAPQRCSGRRGAAGAGAASARRGEGLRADVRPQGQGLWQGAAEARRPAAIHPSLVVSQPRSRGRSWPRGSTEDAASSCGREWCDSWFSQRCMASKGLRYVWRHHAFNYAVSPLPARSWAEKGQTRTCTNQCTPCRSQVFGLCAHAVRVAVPGPAARRWPRAQARLFRNSRLGWVHHRARPLLGRA